MVYNLDAYLHNLVLIDVKYTFGWFVSVSQIIGKPLNSPTYHYSFIVNLSNRI